MKRIVIAVVCLLGLMMSGGQISTTTEMRPGLHLLGVKQAFSQDFSQQTGGGQPLQQKKVIGYADITSIFAERCVMCHSGSGAPLGLQLDSYTNTMAGSNNGPVIVPRNPGDSELVRRIRGISQPRMPLTGPPWLQENEIVLIERWIAEGAPEGVEVGTKEEPPAAPVPEKKIREGPVTYNQVAPIFGKRCVKCHMEKGQMGPPPEGYRMDTYATILAIGDRARVIPGFPDASELVRRIRGQSLPRMPFDGPPYLDSAEIELITRWVAAGARDAEGHKAPLPVGARVRMAGRLTGLWALDSMPLIVDGGTRLKKGPSVGGYVEVRGIVQSDGRIRATRIRPRRPGHD